MQMHGLPSSHCVLTAVRSPQHCGRAMPAIAPHYRRSSDRRKRRILFRIGKTLPPMSLSSRYLKRYQARFRLAKTAMGQIECTKVRLEVDMQPFAACGLRLLGRLSHDGGGKPLVPKLHRNPRVEQEGVHAAVPGNVDEAGQPAGMPHAHPPEAVLVDASPP